MSKKEIKNYLELFFPKDAMYATMDYKGNEDKFLYYKIRKPSKTDWSIIKNYIVKEKVFDAIKFILINLYLEGDVEIRNNEDIIYSLSDDKEFWETITNMTCINDYYNDYNNLTVYIKKGEEEFADYTEEQRKEKLEELYVKEPDNFVVLKFRNKNLEDLQKNYGNDLVQAESQILYNLCIEGEKNLILMDENIYFCLCSGAKHGSISEKLAERQKIIIKKK